MMIDRYTIKKRETVLAAQYMGGITPSHDVIVWITQYGGYGLYRANGRAGWNDLEPNTEHVCVMDEDHRMFLVPGDWIVNLGNNKFEALSNEEFHEKYEIHAKEETDGADGTDN